MTRLFIPPPTLDDLISYCVQWLAINQQAHVSITIDRGEAGSRTEEYDGRDRRVRTGLAGSDARLQYRTRVPTGSAGLEETGWTDWTEGHPEVWDPGREYQCRMIGQEEEGK